MDSPSRNKLLIALCVAGAVIAVIWWSAGSDEAPKATAEAPVAAPPTPPPVAAAVAEQIPPPGLARTAPAARDRPPKRRGRSLVVVEVAAGPGAPPDGPLVLGLHGRGDTAQAFSRVAGQLGPRLAWRFLGAPLPWREGRAWFSDHQRAAPEAEIASALAAIDEQVQLAGRRPLAMFGFSQGCMMLLRYVALHPQALRAGVCIGGAVVGDLPTPDDRPTSPILFVHGADDKVVPASAAREAIQAMENRGFATEFIEHGAGHSIPGQEVSRISDWLRARLALDQPRQTAPD